MQTGIRLIGNGQAPVHRYWHHLLELIRRQETDPLDMVAHRVCLEIERIFRETRAESAEGVWAN